MDSIALSGVRIWDGVADHTRREPGTIRLERGRISSIWQAVSPAGARAVAAKEIHLPGCVAIPGLIDSHVHLDLDPSEARIEKQRARSLSERARALAERAQAMLRAGITTARDLGEGDALALSLRDRIESGEQIGPRLLCAGQPVTSEAGHCHFWGGEAGDGGARAEVVARQLAQGADWIKVMATGGVLTPGSGACEVQFRPEALREITAQAAAAGRHVAAHCHARTGIEYAARAGVRTIEHCSFAGSEGFGSDFDPRLAERLARSDLWISPTVNAGWGRRIERPDDAARPTDFFLRMNFALGALRRAGVAFIASTDAGIPGVVHHRLPEALSVFARYADLSARDALRAATSEAARALGLEQCCGRLRPGLSADLLVLDADPLEDLAALRSPRLVIARGRLVAR